MAWILIPAYRKSMAGSLRFEAGGVQFCAGSAWKAIYTPPPESCSDVLSANPSASSGKYNVVTASGDKLAVYCSFRSSGGWTLVMLSNREKTCPSSKATWNAAINQNVVTNNGYSTDQLPGTPSEMNGLSLMVGLKYWNKLGDTFVVLPSAELAWNIL